MQSHWKRSLCGTQNIIQTGCSQNYVMIIIPNINWYFILPRFSNFSGLKNDIWEILYLGLSKFNRDLNQPSIKFGTDENPFISVCLFTCRRDIWGAYLALFLSSTWHKSVVTTQDARFGEIIMTNGAQQWILRKLQSTLHSWRLHIDVTSTKISNCRGKTSKRTLYIPLPYLTK